MKKLSSKGLGVYKVTLNPKVKNADFEKFMESEVLQSTITFRDGHSAQDELYTQRSNRKTGSSYVWIISRTPSIGGSFSSGTDASSVFKSLKSKVEQFGLITPL